ncbi:MAG TPA: VOC family protein [Acidimicrobiales bacterium]|nr:VOC family protein [Acidimicrobiales bacterium]
MAPIARMRAVVIDCPHPRALADFYSALVGGELTHVEDDWVSLRDGADVRLSFQRVNGFRAPRWPDGEPPQQLHVDVTVDDIDRAEAAVLAFGATKHAFQPGDPDAGGSPDDNWRVYLDPAGHPFCLCWDRGSASTRRPAACGPTARRPPSP